LWKCTKWPKGPLWWPPDRQHCKERTCCDERQLGKLGCTNCRKIAGAYSSAAYIK
jgi:hypothetical protein